MAPPLTLNYVTGQRGVAMASEPQHGKLGKQLEGGGVRAPGNEHRMPGAQHDAHAGKRLP